MAAAAFGVSASGVGEYRDLTLGHFQGWRLQEYWLLLCTLLCTLLRNDGLGIEQCSMPCGSSLGFSYTLQVVRCT